jgi:hypothetical protein
MAARRAGMLDAASPPNISKSVTVQLDTVL